MGFPFFLLLKDIFPVKFQHMGRSSRLTEEQEAGIKYMILNNVPKDVGFPAEFNWTAGLVAKHIKQKYGFNYSIRGITKMLDRLDLTYTRSV